MPLNRTPLTGNQIVAMANVSLERSYTLTGLQLFDSTSIVNELNVLGLPSLLYWIRLNSAVPNVIFTPLFAVQNTTQAGVTVPNWNPLTNGALLVPGNIFTFTIRAAMANAAVQITIPLSFPLPPFLISVDVVITAGA
jgi:hypothetical protein